MVVFRRPGFLRDGYGRVTGAPDVVGVTGIGPFDCLNARPA